MTNCSLNASSYNCSKRSRLCIIIVMHTLFLVLTGCGGVNETSVTVTTVQPAVESVPEDNVQRREQNSQEEHETAFRQLMKEVRSAQTAGRRLDLIRDYVLGGQASMRFIKLALESVNRTASDHPARLRAAFFLSIIDGRRQHRAYRPALEQLMAVYDEMDDCERLFPLLDRYIENGFADPTGSLEVVVPFAWRCGRWEDVVTYSNPLLVQLEKTIEVSPTGTDGFNPLRIELVELLNYRADAFHHMDQGAEAESAFKRAWTLDYFTWFGYPRATQLITSRAKALIRDGHKKKAQELLIMPALYGGDTEHVQLLRYAAGMAQHSDQAFTEWLERERLKNAPVLDSFALQDYQGKTVTLEQFRGGPMLLVFWFPT